MDEIAQITAFHESGLYLRELIYAFLDLHCFSFLEDYLNEIFKTLCHGNHHVYQKEETKVFFLHQVRVRPV